MANTCVFSRSKLGRVETRNMAEGASLGCGKNNIAVCRSQGVPLAA
jgi:hypothetical protein